jgi:hypothetical protein
MFSVTENFLNQIKADDREFSVKLEFITSTTETLTGTTIQSISVDEVVNSADTLTLGCACSNKIVVKLIEPPTNIDYANAVFTAYVGLKVDEENIEEVPLGKFYVTNAETSNDFKTLTLTAYDGFCKVIDKYEPTVEAETTLQAVYDDLRGVLDDKYGITLKQKTLPIYPLKFPYVDVTLQQAIGYVAGCLGGFARFDRLGELEIVSYTDTGCEIDLDVQYMNGFKKTIGKSLEIKSMVTGTQDAPIKCGEGGNGVDINFENPYITQEMANDVWNKYQNIVYTPCQVKWRGNPAIQAGDIVIVTAKDKNEGDHTVLVMSQNIKIGGGLNSTIDCKGKTEITSNLSTKFESVGQKIDRVYTSLEKAAKEATAAITGNKGGYIKILDTNNDGSPDEIVIMNTDDIETATQVWRWNKEGLGHSSNGYEGDYGKAAITADGRICADYITTGTLSAERIAVETNDKTGLLSNYFRVEEGKVFLGKGENSLELRLENDKIGFYMGDVCKAYFSNNSFEIENLTNGKIRFQTFGYVPRENGNLSFTKLV